MSDEDNKPKKKPLNRRSFMASVLGGAAVAGGASSLIAGEAQAGMPELCVAERIEQIQQHP